MLSYSYSLTEESISFVYRNLDRDLRAHFSSSIDFSWFFPTIFFIIRLDLLVLCKIFDVRILVDFLIFSFIVRDFLSFFNFSYLRFHSFMNYSFCYVDPKLKN